MNPAAGSAEPTEHVDATTRLFGPIRIPSESVVRFPHGIPGFPDAIRFVLLEAGMPDLHWMQSLDTPALCFLTVAAARLVPDAWPEFPGARAIVTLPSDTSPATANLRAPILIDREARTGRQWISVDATYSTTHPFDLPSLLATPRS